MSKSVPTPLRATSSVREFRFLHHGLFRALLISLILATFQIIAPQTLYELPQTLYELPVVTRMTLAPGPALLSEFDRELLMGPNALLNRWNPVVEEAAQKFHLPAAWIRAVMRQESGGRTMLGVGVPITSDAGAMGVMQLMPATYGQMAKHYGLGNDPFNPRDNVLAAAAYLRWLHSRYGYPGMFAAYNEGPGKWEAYLHHDRHLPAETRNYVRSIAQFLGDVSLTLGHRKVSFARSNGTAIAIEAAKWSWYVRRWPGHRRA